MNIFKMNHKYTSLISDFAKQHLQNPLVRVFCIALFILIALPSKATHIVGGELYYECQGNNQYKLTLTVYRDCLTGVAQFDDPASIGIFDGVTNQLVSELLLDFNPAINDTLDVVEINPCLEIEDPVCIHRTVYEATVTLPFRNGGYVLAYQRCCRNAAIVNIIEPTETGATYVARVTEEALNECDSSPVFNDWPPIFVCLNRPIDFDHSASDIDGDSLVYRLCTPYLGATKEIPKPQPPNNPPFDNVNYLGSYDINDMLGNPVNPLRINSETGFLTGVPTIKGQFVVGICVDEYRDGILISTTRRDFQYIVGECIEITSAIGNPSIQCDDLNVDFINTSLDATNYIWDFGDPTNPGGTTTAESPSYTYPDTGQYIVTLISQPGDVCADTLEWTLNLRTSTLEPDFNTTLLKCEDGVEIVVNNVSTDEFNTIVDYVWQVDGVQASTLANPSFVVTGDQPVTITLLATATDGCTRSISKVIDPSTFTGAIPRDTIYACEGDLIEMYPDGPDFSIINYEWIPSTSLSNPAIVNPTLTVTNGGLYTLTMSTSGSACNAQVERFIILSDVNNIDIGATITNTIDGTTTSATDTDVLVTCGGETVTLTTANVTTEITNYSWTDANGNPITDNNGSITINPDESTTYTVIITDASGCSAMDQITINPNPVNIQVDELVNIGTDGGGINDITGDGVLDLCPDQVGSINVSNLDGDNLIYTWTGDTGIITAGINSPNPTITANQADGVFTLIVTATNQDGCMQSVEVPIEIHGIPAIDIDVEFTDITSNTTTNITGEDEIVVCGDEMALLTITSTTTLESDVNYTWYNSDGDVSGVNGDLLSITPNGTETYTLIAVNAAGCSSETSITISGSPIDIVIEETDEDLTNGSGLTDLDGDGTLDLCIGNPTSLTVANLDPTDDNTYLWTGDTQILDNPNSQSPGIDYDQEGVYTLYLETINQYGCNQIDTILIEVHDSPNVDIDATITDANTNTETTISGQDVIVSCDDGLIVLNTTGVTSTTSGATIIWFDADGNELGQEDNITVNPDGTETFTVQVSNLFGCSTTTELTIEGSPVDISIDQTLTDIDGNGFPDQDINGDGLLDICPNENFPIVVTNNDANQNLTYNWTADPSITIFGQGSANPAIAASQAGNYDIYLETTNQFGCSQMDTIPVTVLSPQQPTIVSQLQDCIGLNINFDVNNPNYEYYTWNFGDVDNTELTAVEAPSFTYSAPGTYTVTLTPLANLSCLTPLSQQVTVDDSVVDIAFDFAYADCGPDGATIQFTDQSNTSQGSLAAWNWTFSNGETSTMQNPTITVSQNTNLTATLMVTNDTDCEGSSVQNLDISLVEPIVFPNDLTQCPDDESLSLNPNANPDYTYTWSNGLTGVNPSVEPNQTTTYQVTITNNSGAAACQLEQEVTVQVSDEIEIVLDATGTQSGTFTLDNTSTTNTITTCEEEQVNVITTTTSGNDTDYTFEWSPVVNGSTDITVDVDGNPTLTLTVTDDLGCSASSTLTIQGGPVDIEIEQTSVSNANGTGNSAIVNTDANGNLDIDMCLGTSFTLNVNNLDADDVLTYNWSGDIIQAGTENLANPTLNPAAPGIYEITLVTTNQFGCEQTDVIPVTVVDPDAVLSFDFVKDCDGVTINFANNNNPVFDYIWIITDPANPGVVLTSYDAIYTFTEVGEYNISLEVDANVSCVEPAVQSLSIFDPILTAGFDYEFVDCGPDGVTVQFIDQSLNPDDNTTLIEWTINGTTYTGGSVELAFDENATIDVMQTIYTDNDCQTSAEQTSLEVSITEEPNISPNTLTHCQNDTGIELNPNGNPNYTYSWSPEAGLSCTDCPNPMADPDLTTTYTATIVNNNGLLPCTIVREVTLNVPTPIELELADDFETNCVDAAGLTVASNVNVDFEWFESGVSIGNTPNISVTPSGPVSYTIIATDPISGCTEEDAITVTGSGLNVSLDDLTYICQDELGQIAVTSNDPNDILTYEWEGTGEIIEQMDNSIFIPTNEPSAGTYNVTVTNQYGCSSVEAIDAVVLSEPQAPSPGQCEGMTITFNNETDPNAPYLIWDFGDGTPTVTGVTSPEHTYSETGDFAVTATLPNGDECYDNLALTVNVNDQTLEPAYELGFAPDCADDAMLTFNDGSASGNQGNIISWDWDFGDFGTSTEPSPTFEVNSSSNINGTLTILTDAGCEETIEFTEAVNIINDTISIPNLTDCIDFEANLNENPVEGYTFDWADFGLVDSPTVNVNGDASYTVTITNDIQACTAVQEVTVSNHDVVNLEINNGNTEEHSCDEMEIVLMAETSVASDIIWTTNAGIEAGQGNSIPVSTGDGTAATTYIATATDINGCVETDTILVANDEIAIDFSVPQDYSCESGTEVDAIISIPGQQSEQDDLTYVWTGGPMTGATTCCPVFMPNQTTTYTAQVTNEYMCSFEESFTINVSNVEQTIIDEGIIASEDTIFFGNDVDLSVVLGDYLYDWEGSGIDPNDINNTDVNAIPDEVGEVTYEVLVTDAEIPQCSVSEFITITVLQRTCAEPFIFFPNAFSPNGDGENETLSLRYNPAHVTDASWAVYNRWGEKVFETNDKDGEWDGTFQGKAVSPDVYGFWLRTTCADGEEFHKQGNITVLK